VTATVRIPNPDKPLFPDGLTKARLAGYYERIAARAMQRASRPREGYRPDA
jgi:bifunctional non-homologous end joining protein LigD